MRTIYGLISVLLCVIAFLITPVLGAVVTIILFLAYINTEDSYCYWKKNKQGQWETECGRTVHTDVIYGECRIDKSWCPFCHGKIRILR